MGAERTALPDGTVLIVGAGLAGLFLALKLSPRRTCVLSPAPLGESAASAWAQGGLAAALSPEDSPALHAQDTVSAGAGLVDPAVAALIAHEGPARVLDLLALGVPFDRSVDGSLRQSLEAAHSRPRVARVAGDLAGKAIMDALIAAVSASATIDILEGWTARALLQDGNGRVRGVLARRACGAMAAIGAGETVLAVGGAGGLWRVTTNPASALGEGLAMAGRAGALIADPEFMQFHPTAIDVGRDPAPLASEALRGEGAALVDAAGAPFMQAYDARGDLAPRDVVARAIHRQRRTGAGAFLDARAAIGEAFPTHFPTVFAACMQAGLDPRIAPIPVAPAAHYHMGGAVSDLWGRTTLEGLSVVGECASTGVHGANRLASNSLLESVVFAHRTGQRLRESEGPVPESQGHGEAPPELPEPARRALRATIDAHLGVERTEADRAAALADIAALIGAHGLSNEALAAAFIAEAAARRLESRGAHFCPDHPEPAPHPAHTFLTVDDLTLVSAAKPPRRAAREPLAS